MRFARIAVAISALMIVLSVGPAGANSSKKPTPPPSVPPCSHLSSTKLAKYFDVGALKFEGVTPHSDICT